MTWLCKLFALCATLHGYGVALDGDTIKVDGVHVRLWGIDAEELDEPHGVEALHAMQSLLRYGMVECRQIGKDHYGRTVATCSNPYADLGAAMVSAGLALDCQHYSGGAYRHLEPPGARSRLIQKPYC